MRRRGQVARLTGGRGGRRCMARMASMANRNSMPRRRFRMGCQPSRSCGVDSRAAPCRRATNYDPGPHAQHTHNHICAAALVHPRTTRGIRETRAASPQCHGIAPEVVRTVCHKTFAIDWNQVRCTKYRIHVNDCHGWFIIHIFWRNRPHPCEAIWHIISKSKPMDKGTWKTFVLGV